MTYQRNETPEPLVWVFFNEKTATYETRDGTKVAAELADEVTCFAEVLHIAKIRGDQRAAAIRAQAGGDQC